MSVVGVVVNCTISVITPLDEVLDVTYTLLGVLTVSTIDVCVTAVPTITTLSPFLGLLWCSLRTNSG